MNRYVRYAYYRSPDGTVNEILWEEGDLSETEISSEEIAELGDGIHVCDSHTEAMSDLSCAIISSIMLT